MSVAVRDIWGAGRVGRAGGEKCVQVGWDTRECRERARWDSRHPRPTSRGGRTVFGRGMPGGVGGAARGG
ncbi:hypothetical protein Asi03nite_07790 [Actinoplanes siamensis]|uniref:Uncharacterized protein n=1 Tax=Actinoplanes siamensis TaxID=1223317 RepID=A0A919KCG9_9ACTN|nr:hypothetical protein Asi03nite_07790 [Actinoplanes siamensis]